MGYSLHDALTEQAESVEVREQEVACDECGETFIVAFRGDEPVELGALDCHCGGALREL